MPDQRTRAGRRDHAILLVLGETGIRNFQLRALTGTDLLRRRRDSPTRSIRVHGKGGRGRLLTLPRHADQAVEEWLARHPLAVRAGSSWALPADAPLFVTLGRHDRDVRELRGRDAEQDAKQIGKLSTSALEDLVAKHLCAAGVARTLAHPHTLRAYHLTRLKQLGVRDDAIRERSGHADPRVLYSHYLALVDGDRDALVEALDVAASSRR